MDKNTSKILISDHIFTGIGDRPVSGAVVITDHKITAVTTKEEALKLRDRDTIVYELGDQLVCPGFVDNHVFFTGFVWSHLGADLSGAGSKKDAAEILAQYAKELPKGKSVFGHGLPAAVLESEEDMDEALRDFGDTAVIGFAEGRDGCMMNQAAREKYGFDEREVYAEVCWRVFDEYLREEEFILQEYEKFSDLLASRGVTSIKEIGFDRYSGFTKLLSRMEKEGKLKHRVNLVSQPVGYGMDYSYAKECQELFTGNFIQFMGYNVMVDGEIASNNADVIDAYCNLPGSHGEQEIDYQALEEMTVRADALGLRCALHAEGDGAVRRTIDIFEKCRKVNGERDSRHIITDLEMVRTEDLKRMAELGITACNYVQILDCLGDYEEFYGYDCVGENGIRNYWPYQRMFENGVHAVCGTDLPLTVPDIPLSAYLTVNRTFPDGRPEGGMNRECALTVDQILKAWTREGQYANFKEEVLGTLEPGKLADLAVIDQNLFEMEPEKLKEAKVSMTICNGNVVYQNL